LPNRIRKSDVVVIGGGAIGLAIAWRAAQRGLGVTLLERGRFGEGTSRVAAGMLAPIAEARPTEQPLLHLNQASVKAYPGFADELSEASGMDVGYLRCGTLVAARDRDDAEALERELEMRLALGLPVSRLRASEARRLEPALAPSLRLALEVADDHAIDPRLLTAALVEAGLRAGARLRAGAEVATVEVSPRNRVSGVRLTDGEVLETEHVVIAGGVWSEAIEGIPHEARVPIRPVKGQILRLHDPSGAGLVSHIVRIAGSYIVPRGDGRYVLGATMEERGFDTAVTAGATFELLREVIEVVPGVSELVIDEVSAGLRPATPDNAPAIGPTSVHGLWWAAGHHRNGILLTPITAEIVAGMLVGEQRPELAAAFAPARFARGAAQSSTRRDRLMPVGA
jgi:glycine oxidase